MFYACLSLTDNGFAAKSLKYPEIPWNTLKFESDPGKPWNTLMRFLLVPEIPWNTLKLDCPVKICQRQYPLNIFNFWFEKCKKYKGTTFEKIFKCSFPKIIARFFEYFSAGRAFSRNLGRQFFKKIQNCTKKGYLLLYNFWCEKYLKTLGYLPLNIFNVPLKSPEK